MARLYGEEENISSEKIKEFFNERANKKVDHLLSITEYQDAKNVEERHEKESEILLNELDLKDKVILEIGCGIGRWAEVFHDKCKSYNGIDYSENLIEIANENYNYSNCHFQYMSAVDISRDALTIKEPFDIVVITGVLLYINDEDIKKISEIISKLIHEDSVIFIKEPLSNMDTRLTLKDFYSEELENEYNAIYRTPEELLSLFENVKKNYSVKRGDMYNNLNKREETSYKYFVIK